jgi:Kelch motif
MTTLFRIFSTNFSTAVFVALIVTTAITCELLPSPPGCTNLTPSPSTLKDATVSGGYSKIAGSPPVGRMGTGQADAGSGVMGGLLYLVGGYGYTAKNPLTSVSVYSFASNRWTPGPDYPVKAWGIACTALRTSLFCFGGTDAGLRAYKLNGGSLIWTRLADMPSEFNDSQGHVAISEPDSNRIYILGSSNDIAARKMTIAYDATGNSYTRLRDMPIGNAWFTAGLFEGKIYTIGGIQTAEVLVYDIAHDSWSASGACLPGPPRYGMIRDPGLFNGLIPVVDGRTPGSVFYAATVFYDVINNGFLQGPPTLLPRDGVAGGMIENHLIVAGGRNDTGTPYGLAYAEELNLYTGH